MDGLASWRWRLCRRRLEPNHKTPSCFRAFVLNLLLPAKIAYTPLDPTLTLTLTPEPTAPKITLFSQNPQISRRKRKQRWNDNARHSF
jgi:hypothetical protein